MRCGAEADAASARLATELRAAVARLAAGGLVAFPTETLWGLAAVARSAEAVAGLRRFKGRDPALPLSVLLAEPDAIETLGGRIDARVRALVRAFWPGPLTLVIAPAATGTDAAGWPLPAARADGALGLRCSPHPVARALAAAARDAGLGPLTATSLNRSGEPAARTRDEARTVRGALADETPFVLGSGPDAGGGAPSTVVECGQAQVRILRAGAIDAARIRALLDAPVRES